MSLGLPPGVVQAQESPPTVQESPAAAAPEVPLSGEEAAEGFSAEPAPPELPARLEDGQPIEPEITIVRQRDAVVHEYRANGRLFMVRVTPKVGKPYYLMDRDGDGRMESRMSEIYDEIAVPQWVIFSW
ncbi:MAG: DUF2782 domain-containing protein [Gammaproteobacteria bacterium]|nr:DUF2782 domain-containing protein [Gammaproteobacteria bacterium]